MAQHSWLIGVLSGALLLGACGHPEPEAPVAEAAPRAGRLTLESRPVADMKPVPGTLTTRDMAEARARISGTLVMLSVKEGDMVRQGQLIGRVTDARLTLQTGAFDAQVAAAAAEADRANADLARTRTLFSQGIYAQARLDQVEAQARAADASLAAARAQRGASAELAGQGAILAPATGRVLAARIPVGSVLMPGQSLATITAGPMVVRLELPEGQARALQVGDIVQLSAEDLRGAATQGSISQIYPSITGGQVIADVSAPGLPQDLVGQRVRAQVRIGERQALIVPRRYIITRFGIDYARLVRADGTLSETPVQTVAGPGPDTLEVLAGLRAGDVLSPAGPVR
jgi:RND family efflux transporter MFP subunit